VLDLLQVSSIPVVIAKKLPLTNIFIVAIAHCCIFSASKTVTAFSTAHNKSIAKDGSGSLLDYNL